jgi:hypothetical protein
MIHFSIARQPRRTLFLGLVVFAPARTFCSPHNVVPELHWMPRGKPTSPSLTIMKEWLEKQKRKGRRLLKRW